jgi:hypothetical protein
MFQQMLNASRTVLLRPSVATFEEYERNDAGWAYIYIAIAAVVSAILSAIGFAITGPARAQALRQLEDQFGGAGRPLPPGVSALMGGAGLTGTILLALVGTIIVFFFWTGLIYLLGRAFGGTGAYGELAYDVALFSAPITVISSLISLLSIGPLACLTGLIGLALWIYRVYLTWLSVQSGMNLPGNKALMVILIPILVILLLVCGCVALFFVVIAGSQQSR